MFASVLIANRGEVALRVIRTLRRLGLRSVAVFAADEADAPHVRLADVAVALTGAGGRSPYLDGEQLVAAALRSGAEAVHPGYGFLSENAAFAQAVVDAGLVWIGPPPGAIEAMGDKARAKLTAQAAGVPVVAGAGGAAVSDDQLVAAAAEVGYPVLIKPSAGGGGKGMQVVEAEAGLRPALDAARRVAEAAFGDGTLLIERYVADPRHIEIQVLADAHGATVHLGERECSLQRRHQKVVEEAPSPLLDADLRAAMGAAAVRAAEAVGYRGAGTVEMIVPGADPWSYAFMEMNTRLQVEHPVTEAVYDLDLVEWQLRVAAGERLPWTQKEVLARARGHAIEARVYAEDPEAGFVPSSGRLLAWSVPDQVRVDAGVERGSVVGSAYDPMLAKVVAWGADRAEALARLDDALRRSVVLGLRTNIGFLRRLLAEPDVQAGRLDTGLIGRLVGHAPASPAAGPEASGADLDVPAPVLQALALAPALAAGPVLGAGGGGPWERLGRWRLGPPQPEARRLRHRQREYQLTVWPEAVAIDGGPPTPVRAGAGSVADPSDGAVGPSGAAVGLSGVVTGLSGVTTGLSGVTTGLSGVTTGLSGAAGGGPIRLQLEVAGLSADVWLARAGVHWWVAFEGATYLLEELPPRLEGRPGRDAVTAGAGVVRSPMPGTVRAVRVAPGDRVSAGDGLVVVEAMKMEHVLTAPHTGRVTAVPVREGDQVTLDAVVVEIEEVPTP